MGVFGERLIEARTRLGWHQAELARRTGVPQQSIHTIETSDQRTSKYLHQFATALGVTSQWLMGEDDPPGDASPVSGRAPVLGLVAAGLWQEEDRLLLDETPVPSSPNPSYSKHRQIAFRVVGTSMDRLVADGEYVICIGFAGSPTQLRNGDGVVAERRRGGATERTVKRVRTLEDRTELWPDSNDPEHQTPLVLDAREDDSEVVVVGIVIGFYRPL